MEGVVVVYNDNSYSSTINSDSFFDAFFDPSERPIRYFDNAGSQTISNTNLVSSEPSLSTRSLYNRIATALGLEASINYFFSDYQLISPSDLRVLLEDSTKWYNVVLTHNINSERNVSVDSLYIRPNPDNLSEVKIIVEFQVFNIREGNIVVKLTNDSKQLSSLVRDISELDLVEFSIPKSNYGNYKIQLDGDDVDFDNTFYFSIGRQVKPWITIINETDSRFINEVYGNSELFNTDFQSINNLDYERLERSSLIVLSGLSSIPASLQSQLDVSFLVFPSEPLDPESYSSFIGIGLTEMAKNNQELTVDYSHPLLRGVFDRNGKDITSTTADLIFNTTGNYETIISTRGGRPFLLRSGSIYFFNSFFSETESGFETNALFLPLLYQIAFTENDKVESPYFYPGDFLSVRAQASDVPLKIKGDSYEQIPAFNSLGQDLILEIPEEIEPGVYTLIDGEDSLRNIAVNIPKRESIMMAPSLAELKDAFKDKENIKVMALSKNDDTLNPTMSSQSSLWKYALILTLLFVLTETMLHRFLK